MSKNAKRFALGTLLAAVAGYVTGILTAPKSGKETRQDIKTAASEGLAEAEKHLKELHTQLNKTIDTARERVAKVKGAAQTDISKAVDLATKAKDKARDVLSAVHEGEANDKDLAKAVNEAQKALKHLKTFLKKS